MISADDIAREELLKKFKRVGPICEGVVMVFDGQSEFHITLTGMPLYTDRYAYVGSFCNGFAWVRTKGKSGREFHIRKDGTRPYRNDFKTAGDFDANGRAKVSLVDGVEFFIDVNGLRVASA